MRAVPAGGIRRLFVLGMLQVGLVAGAVAADPWFSYGYPRFERVCEGIRNAGECAARIETSQLASNRNAVERVPKGIHIRTRSGGLVELKDGPPGVSGWSYFYRELLSEIDSHVIFIGRYEGTSWMLVDAEPGHRTALQAPPIVSPDHQRFVTISMDLDASYNPNSVRIWVMAAGAPRLEWELSPDTWGPILSRWVGSQQLIVEKATLAGPTGEALRLVRIDGIWTRDAVAK